MDNIIKDISIIRKCFLDMRESIKLFFTEINQINDSINQKTKITCLSAGGRIGPGKFLGKNTCKWTPGPPGPEPPEAATTS